MLAFEMFEPTRARQQARTCIMHNDARVRCCRPPAGVRGGRGPASGRASAKDEDCGPRLRKKLRVARALARALGKD
jgi:hypothetical protein